MTTPARGSHGARQVQRPWGGMEGQDEAEGARRTVSEGVHQGSSVSRAGRRRTLVFKERMDVGETAGFGLDGLLGNLTVKVVRG